MAIPVIGTVMKKVFGTRNERMVKRYLRIVDQVSDLEQQMRGLSDQQIREKTVEFRKRIKNGEEAQSLIPEVFAAAREAMDRAVGIRNIFNPAESFDSSKLPAEARRLYDETKAVMAATPDREPTGDLLGNEKAMPAWTFVDIPAALYEAVRELHPMSKPPYRARPFDVQIIGAIVLYEGRIAEMKTGEGKTIVAPLACYLAACQDRQVHVVTVNDYLVQRDRDWTAPFFRALGLTVGAIHPYHMQPPQLKAVAYKCDVVYGTTSEFGFDYLRDNMKLSVQEQVQRRREVAIVDEVDSILIDEARTPLIISGPAHQHSPRYALADKLARHLLEKQKEWNAADQLVQSCKVEFSGLEGDIRNARDKSAVPAMKARMDEAKARLPKLEAERDRFTQFYELELDKKKATITHDGITEAQRIADIGSFYVGDNIDMPHLLEQAVRAHTVYQRDRDYVVAPGEEGEPTVVIVDQNTGRKMVGRQWSDGLHQAVEAKEAVPIKQETQTMATITIQNFFKLYKKLAGMTGTADTEATEFYEIYKLDVVVIPTNVPVIRRDSNDLVFISVKDKWNAIVDEIKAFHDGGRPVLVGTTSVEKSEMLSEMLLRRHGIKHEVLNAKQHDREAEIIQGAGQLGAVMIATNMAGRGTDIRLGQFTREQLVDHWKRRGICPREATADMADEKIMSFVHRHLAQRELKKNKGELDVLSDDDVRLMLLRYWYTEKCRNASRDPEKMNAQQLEAALDEAGTWLMHRLRMFNDVADLGGLHVVGTERHESRRIDNQLRGRSGRQGDNGSSRFHLSLEDDLMKMFAGPTTLKVLSRLGMKEGDAIEHAMLTKSVERAQRKVEERNFLHRKQILEYDEIMNMQRGRFYGMRQDILEGRHVKELIFDHIDASTADATATYLGKQHAAKCIAEWVREHLGVWIEPERIRGKDREDLHKLIMVDAKEETSSMIGVTIGEYMPEDIDLGDGKVTEGKQEDWDLKGLADWANATFKAGVTTSQLQGMSREEVVKHLERAAAKQIDAADLSPLDQYLVADYGAHELARWATNKLASEFKPDEFKDVEDVSAAAHHLMDRARAVYERREITYPIDFALQMTSAQMQHNPQQAIGQFCAWVNSRYELDWKPDALPSSDPNELQKLIIAKAESIDDAQIQRRAQGVVAAGQSVEAIDTWFRTNMGARLTEEEKARAEKDPEGTAAEKIRSIMRSELTQFERWVLLQIIDQAWKDHLYSMDQIRDSIGLRSFAQKDSRIEYKREGARLFDEMQASVRDKVTDLVFKAKLSAQVVQRPQPSAQPVAAGALPEGASAEGQSAGESRQTAAPRPTAPPPPRVAQPATAAAAAAVAGTPAQRRDLETAERAGAPNQKPKRRPVKAVATVGRNEPCPCGSGKKFKQCCGK